MVVTALLISCVFSQQTFPYLQLGTNLRNNSVVNLSSIGTTDQLRCVTDLDTCCSTAQGSAERAWILPNGTRLTQDGVQEISSFTVTAEESVLALQLTDLDVRSNPALSGIYEYCHSLVYVDIDPLIVYTRGIFASDLQVEYCMVGSMRKTGQNFPSVVQNIRCNISIFLQPLSANRKWPSTTELP